MALISIREFARRNGVSHVAIRQAVKTGRLPSVDGKIDPDVAQPVWDRVKGPRARQQAPAGWKLPAQVTAQVSTEVTTQVSTERGEHGAATPAEVTSKVSSEVTGRLRRRPITFSINGAEYLELDSEARQTAVTIPAYVRSGVASSRGSHVGARWPGAFQQPRRPSARWIV